MRAPIRIAPLLLLLALAACAPPPQRLGPSAPLPSTAPPWSAQALGRYRIDPERSQVAILVYRAGTLAALGHDHVIEVGALSGELTLASSAQASHFNCEFPVASLRVDPAASRAALGPPFSAPLDQASIDGTRMHMLGAQQLDAARFPTITLRSLAVRSDGALVDALLRVTVRAHSAQTQFHAQLEQQGDSVLLQGEVELTHAQLGLTPYSLALGALRVAEGLKVRYRLVAVRVP